MLHNVITNIELDKKPVMDADVRQTIMAMKRASNPVINWEDIRRRNGEWERPEYDFAEIERFADVEALLAQSFRKKLGLFIKEGYDFVGRRPELVDYVKLRLSQIAWVSGKTERRLIEDIYYDLVRFSNSYVVKVRDVKASGGYTYKDPRDGVSVKPIAGLFILPAPSTEFKTNDNNHISRWRQYVPGTKKLHREYDVKDIAHFYLNRKKGFANGTPRVLPVLEDIKALRRIEENVELLVVQNIFPLIHYKVGTETDPAREDMNGRSEITHVMGEIERMPPEGVYVTPERHEIKMIGTEGRALRVEAYLDYFKKRVLAGLSLSTVDIGEGGTANRNTADTMSRSMVDEVKSDQRVFEDMFQELIINELLMEASEDIDVSEEDNRVYLRFREIDYDTKIKKENHAIQKFLQNSITHKELRMELGLNEMTEEEFEDSYFKKIEEPKLLLAAAADPMSVGAQTSIGNAHTATTSGDVAKAQQAQERMVKIGAKAKAAASAKTASSKTNKTTANRNRPTNQHGTKSSSAKSVKDYVICDSEISDLKHELRLRANTRGVKDTNLVVGFYTSMARDRITKLIRDSYREGAFSVGANIEDLSSAEILRRQDQATSNGQKYVARLFAEIDAIAKSGGGLEDMMDRIDAIQYRLRYIENTESMRAYNWGAVSALAQMGESMYNIDIGTDSDANEKQAASRSHLVANATFSSIPPWHPNSTVRIIRASNG